VIVLCGLAGLLAGSLLNWISPYTLRFTARGADLASDARARPAFALWHILKTFTHPSSRRHKECGQRHSRTDAAVELFTALLFAYLWARFGLSWKLLWMALTGSFFVLIAIDDLRYRLVPNALVYPAAAATLTLQLVIPGQRPLNALLGGAVGLAPFLLVALLKPGEIGGGDVKLAALIGLMVGFPSVFWALLLATAAGGITAVLLLLTGRWGPKSHIPYAPFLCLGAMCCLMCPIPIPAFAL